MNYTHFLTEESGVIWIKAEKSESNLSMKKFAHFLTDWPELKRKTNGVL